jgi:hypothetical protein
MVDSFPEFLAEHRGEHRTTFNRWYLIAGDTLQLTGVIAAIRRHWRRGGVMVAAGYAVVIAGHIRDGNLPKSFQTARLHPLWTIRGDMAIARDVVTGAQKSHGAGRLPSADPHL